MATLSSHYNAYRVGAAVFYFGRLASVAGEQMRIAMRKKSLSFAQCYDTCMHSCTGTWVCVLTVDTACISSKGERTSHNMQRSF